MRGSLPRLRPRARGAVAGDRAAAHVRPRPFVVGSLLVVAAVLVWWRVRDQPAREAPRVLLVAVDGATWDVMTPMMERGELPTFQRLAERGIASPLRTFQP